MHRILVVDDNEANREMLARRLERRGYTVLLATNGVECLELVAFQRPDLILLDVEMPVMDGLEAARRLKGNEQTRQIPIIAVTAHTMTGDDQRALAAGCDGYHPKPIEFMALCDQLDKLLVSSNCSCSSPSQAPAISPP